MASELPCSPLISGSRLCCAAGRRRLRKTSQAAMRSKMTARVAPMPIPAPAPALRPVDLFEGVIRVLVEVGLDG